MLHALTLNFLESIIIKRKQENFTTKTERSYKLSVTDDMYECIQMKVGVNDDKNDIYK